MDVNCQLQAALPLGTHQPKEQVGLRACLGHWEGEKKI